MELAGRPSAITAAHAVRHKARRCMRITYLPVFSYALPHVHFTRRFGIHLGDGPTVGRHSPCFMIRPFCRRQLHTIHVQRAEPNNSLFNRFLSERFDFPASCWTRSSSSVMRASRIVAAERVPPDGPSRSMVSIFPRAFFPHTSVAVPQRVDTHTHNMLICVPTSNQIPRRLAMHSPLPQLASCARPFCAVAALNAPTIFALDGGDAPTVDGWRGDLPNALTISRVIAVR